jgi:hypothetical protein
MNPEDQIPGTPAAQGAPLAANGPTDAEYQDLAKQRRDSIIKEQAEKPPEQTPTQQPEPSKLSQFFDATKDYFKKGLAKQETLGQLVPEVGKGVARGTVDAGMWTADKLNRAATATGAMSALKPKPSDQNFVDKWMSTPLVDDRPMTGAEEDTMLGKRDAGVENFVEGATQMGVGAGVALASGGAAALVEAGAGTVVAGSVAGGLGVAVATDPYVKRASSMLANAPSYISTPINAVLAADPTDSYPTALLKSALENTMTFYAIDKFAAGLGVLKAKMMGGDVAAAQDAVAAVKHDPATQGPIITHQTEDGQFAIVDNSKPTAEVPVGTDRRAAPREGAVDRRATSRDYSQMTHEELARAHFGLTSDALTQARIAQDALSRNEDAAITAVREAKITRITDEADRVKELMAAKTGPTFATSADAEGVAAAMNEDFLNDARTTRSITAQVQMIEHLRTLRADGGGELGASDLMTSAHPDFDFSYSLDPEQVRATVTGIADILPRTIGVQTHAETAALADDLIEGKTGDEVVQMLRDKNVSTQDLPQHIHAGRLLMNSLGAKIAKLSRAADAQPENAFAFQNLHKSLQFLMDVHEHATGLISTSGRALDANKMALIAESSGDAAARGTGEAGAAEAATKLVGEMDKPDLLALARQIRMANGDPNGILQLVRAQLAEAKIKPTFDENLADATGVMGKAGVIADAAIQRLNGIRVEAMLSGPKTQVTYVVSHILAALQMPSEVWWGGLVSGNKAMRQEGADELAGMFMNLRDCWAGARRALNTGSSILDPQGSIMLDAGGTGMATNDPLNVLSQGAHIPSRMLTSIAEFFKQMNYRSSVRAQSLRLAREDGLTDATEIATRVSDDMKAAFTEKGAALNPKALDKARAGTFQTPLEQGTFGKWIQTGVQEHPAGRLIMPFVRTPVNLDIYAWQRTPILGMFQRQMRADIAAGGERRALAFAKQSMGLATWGGAAALVYNKMMTGGGPANPALNKQWRDAGNQPYSIKVPGGGWVSYNRANPSLTALGIVADAVEASGELKYKDYQELAAAFTVGIAKNLTNKTFMQGIAETLDAASNGTIKTVEKWWDSLGGSFVPNVLNQTNPDDTLREIRGMTDELKSRVPGLSTTLEPRRNILGEPIMKPPGSINDALNPFTWSPRGDHSKDVQQQLVDLGKGMAMPPTMYGKLNLADRDTYDNGTHQSPYDRMLEMQSQSRNGMPNLRDKLTQLLASQRWKDAGSGNESYPGGKRYALASQVISEYQQKAFKDVQREYPKLKDAVTGGKHDKVNAVRNPAAPPWKPQFLPQ